MAQWSPEFEQIMEQMDTDMLTGTPEQSLLHAFIESWKAEVGALIWIVQVPGDNVFGANIVFVNDEVINELQWTFAEWINGTASQGVFRPIEAEKFKLHLLKKTRAPILAHIRKKNTPQNQDGNDYFLHIHHNLPYQLRLTVAVPYEA